MTTGAPVRIEHPLAVGLEVPAEDLWSFPEGLIGLPDFQRFALIDPEGTEPFRVLCSADDPEFGLVVVEPKFFVPDYVVALTPEDLGPLSGVSPDSIDVLVPVVLPHGDRPFSLNLKGPILLAPGLRRGIQRVSGDDSHGVRFAPDVADSSAGSCSS